MQGHAGKAGEAGEGNVCVGATVVEWGRCVVAGNQPKAGGGGRRVNTEWDLVGRHPPSGNSRRGDTHHWQEYKGEGKR